MLSSYLVSLLEGSVTVVIFNGYDFILENELLANRCSTTKRGRFPLNTGSIALVAFQM